MLLRRLICPFLQFLAWESWDSFSIIDFLRSTVVKALMETFLIIVT